MKTVLKHGTSILRFHTPFLSPLSLCHSIASLMVDHVTHIEVMTSHSPLPPLPVCLPGRYHPVWPTVYPEKVNNDFEYRGKVLFRVLSAKSWMIKFMYFLTSYSTKKIAQ